MLNNLNVLKLTLYGNNKKASLNYLIGHEEKLTQRTQTNYASNIVDKE